MLEPSEELPPVVHPIHLMEHQLTELDAQVRESQARIAQLDQELARLRPPRDR